MAVRKVQSRLSQERKEEALRCRVDRVSPRRPCCLLCQLKWTIGLAGWLRWAPRPARQARRIHSGVSLVPYTPLGSRPSVIKFGKPVSAQPTCN